MGFARKQPSVRPFGRQWSRGDGNSLVFSTCAVHFSRLQVGPALACSEVVGKEHWRAMNQSVHVTNASSGNGTIDQGDQQIARRQARWKQPLRF
jgi:hypothetical protein